MKVERLVANEYGTFFLKVAYLESINLVPDWNTVYPIPDAIASLSIMPPMTRRPPGRPKRCTYLSTRKFKV
ncbi:unnamed protein product [Arabis nemorensis]|uniref:Uncharacterized protein n=1 Tax=Arabis nemorensis TaxID=586526 RepID=A0A565BVD7_9BRAS|nr:unnamed protein product [Arabis nemorensis]